MAQLPFSDILVGKNYSSSYSLVVSLEGENRGVTRELSIDRWSHECENKRKTMVGGAFYYLWDFRSFLST
jgi:hypothetical protein